MTPMTQVFISYSRKDQAFVRRLHNALENMQRDTWIDWSDIPPTSDWWNEIRTGIEQADNFVFIISPNSIASPICQMEIDYARSCSKRLVPIVLIQTDEKSAFAALAAHNLDENTRALLAGRDPLVLARDNWQALARHNWLFFEDSQDFDTTFNRLIQALDTDIDYLRNHTRLLVRAREWVSKEQNPSFLLQGAAISEAESWLGNTAGKEPPASALHITYITASRKAATRRQQVQLAAVTLALVVTAALAILAVLLGLSAETQRILASDNASTAIAARATSERSAVESRSLALGAIARQLFASQDPDYARAYALAANQMTAPPQQAITDLYQVGYAPGTIRILTGHHSQVNSVAFTPDGRALSGSADGTMILWDVQGEKPIRQFKGHDKAIWSVAVSADGQYALSGSADNTLVLWDIATGALIRRFAGHSDVVTSVAFSPTDPYVLSGSRTGWLILWDMETGQQKYQMEGHQSSVSSVAFSPDGQMIVSGARDSIILWDVKTGTILSRLAENLLSASAVTSVAFSPDSDYAYVVSGSADHSVTLWDRATGQPIRHYFGHEDFVFSVGFTPDAQHIISASADGTIRLWDVNSGDQIQRLDGHHQPIYSVAIDPTGRTLLSGSHDGTVRVWDIENGMTLQRLSGHHDWVTSISMSRDGRYVLSGSRDASLILWDAATGKARHRFNGQDQVTSVALSPDGQLALSAGIVNGLQLWNVQTGDPICCFKHDTQGAKTVAFSPDGTYAVSGSLDGLITAWDVKTLAVLRTFGEHSKSVNSVTFSADGRYLLSGGADQVLILWDAKTGKAIRRFANEISAAVMTTAFSPDSRYVLCGTSDGLLLLWDKETDKVLQRFRGHTKGISSAMFSPDGQYILSGSDDKTLRLWNTQSGQIVRVYEGHYGAVTAVTFLAGGEKMMSASTDNSLILWQLEPGDMMAWVRQHRYVPEICLRSDGITDLCPPAALPTSTAAGSQQATTS
jgi:WD40 repeat protein